MHDHATKTYAMLQHDDRSPQKKATLTSNIGALRHGKRSQHQQKPALTKFKGAHLLKWLVAFSLLGCAAGENWEVSSGESSGSQGEPCAHELADMKKDHAAELKEVQVELASLKQQLREVRQCRCGANATGSGANTTGSGANATGSGANTTGYGANATGCGANATGCGANATGVAPSPPPPSSPPSPPPPSAPP